jgi:XTP/dITP diphosphohydrolase
VILLATKNPGKLKDMQHLLEGLGEPFGLAEGVGEIEETGATFEENALLKARAVAAARGLPAIGDDSGLEVDALGGEPGVRSARYAGVRGSGHGDLANNRLLLEKLAGVPREKRTARFRSVLAFVDPAGLELVATGVCEGLILEAPLGSGGFGYDPLFYSPEIGMTFAEATIHEKARVSHRARAAEALVPRLKEYLRVAKDAASR